MQTTTSIIIGMGEVGKALHSVLTDYYNVVAVDADKINHPEEAFDIMHVCFPYSTDFVTEVLAYQDKFKPKHTIIHSTVPIGTSRKCGAIHSPVNGIHPKMEESLRTFEKFIGGEMASEVADYFRRAGFTIRLFDKAETTELMKILDTTFYGLCIEYTKEVKRLADMHKVPFEAWTLWTQNYNNGYQDLGYPEYMRPNLVPIMRRIGGHCVLPNADLLQSKFTQFLKQLNS